jgi:hypothetical protein
LPFEFLKFGLGLGQILEEAGPGGRVGLGVEGALQTFHAAPLALDLSVQGEGGLISHGQSFIQEVERDVAIEWGCCRVVASWAGGKGNEIIDVAHVAGQP